MWDVASRQPIGPPLNVNGYQCAEVSSVAFSHAGAMLAATGYDWIWLWDLQMNSLIRHACGLANRNLMAGEWAQFFGGEPYHKTCPSLP